MVVDYGGSTLDFSIADISDGVVEILATISDFFTNFIYFAFSSNVFHLFSPFSLFLYTFFIRKKGKKVQIILNFLFQLIFYLIKLMI